MLTKLTRSAPGRAMRVTYRWKRPMLPWRSDLPALLNARGLTGRGAEVGVKCGLFSEEILDGWNGDELVSIDPWEPAPADEWDNVDNVGLDEQQGFLDETTERLVRFGKRSAIWRDYSTTAAEKVEDASLDFVYLDARHDYASVKEDVETWWPKVKAGGILAGHDYFDGQVPEGDFGVRSAVDEFFGARQLPVLHSVFDTSSLSWFVIVPS